MGRIEDYIRRLEQYPEKIKEVGKEVVRANIVSHNNYDNGDMYTRVEGSVSGEHVKIRVNTFYAHWVNDGRGPVVPKVRQTWKRRNVKALHIKGSNKYYEGYSTYVKPYPGSHFFDDAFAEIDANIESYF